MEHSIASVPDLIGDLQKGKPIILVDHAKRENEGDIVILADFVSVDALNLITNITRGVLCVVISQQQADRLHLPLMVPGHSSPSMAAFAVSVEAASGVGTGVSIADRVRTIRALVSPDSCPEDLIRPGHVQPLIAKNGGVLVRSGHTEASIDLAILSGSKTNAAIICELLNEDGSVSRMADLQRIAADHGLKLGMISDLVIHRCIYESFVDELSCDNLNFQGSSFRVHIFQNRYSGCICYAVKFGDVESRNTEVPLFVYNGPTCFDFLDDSSDIGIAGSLRCVASKGRGVVLLLHPSGINSLCCSGDLEMDSALSAERLCGVAYQVLRSLRVSSAVFAGGNFVLGDWVCSSLGNQL